MTTAFENITDDGNEPALRRGRVVPEGAVNLAWAQSPRLSPKENVVIVDTSRIVEENAIELAGRRQLYYANSLGILEDENGNQLVDDEFPLVTDVFTIDEDYIALPASEYKPEHILPFVHVSRYFHRDFIGLTLPGDLLEFREDILKVVDVRGRPYVDGEGNPRYKVRIASAIMRNADPYARESAYRVYVYLDDDVNEELYLTYHKVELDNNGQMYSTRLNYRELLNLKPVFEYVPEESEVVDRPSWNKQIYSSKPISLKEQVLGRPFPNVDGYKIYVPKKAKGDPRIFQLFHWRLKCDFVQPYQVDTTRVGQSIKVGTVVTNSNGQSTAPYCLLNLSRSGYNATDVILENPLRPASGADKATAAYWNVNFDTVTLEDLKRFDFLVWAPTTPAFDFQPYMAKIDYFTRVVGGTLFIDSSNYTVMQGLGIGVSNGLSPNNGAAVTTGGAAGGAQGATTVDAASPLFDGGTQLGGWKIPDTTNNDEIESLSWIKQLFSPAYSQTMSGIPSGWSTIVSHGGEPVVLHKTIGTGNLIVSTFSILYSCSALFSHSAPALIDANRGATLATYGDYTLYINASSVEGAMKFLFNALLLSVKGRSLDASDSRAYSTAWSFYTNWEASWVINNRDNALSQAERERHAFKFLPEDSFVNINTQIWKRQLDSQTCEQLMNTVLFADPEMRRQQEGAVRTYTMEVTNTEVLVASHIEGPDNPFAWTKAYTPKFVVPVELGPNVVREEEFAGRYSTGQYEHRTYPPKPYAGRIQTTYVDTAEQLQTRLVNWTATGYATETYTITEEIPPVYSTQTTWSEVRLNWWDYPQGGSRSFGTSTLPWRKGYQYPVGIATWQEMNYLTNAWGSGHLNWPFFGLTDKYQSGSSGEVVQFIQEALNRFRAAGFYSGRGPVPVDGRFGATTAGALWDFQVAMGARYVDGVVDAESWSLIGYQILRGGWTSGGNTNFLRFFDWPYGRLKYEHISDGNTSTPFAKRSWHDNGPSVIWDMFSIVLNQKYNIHALTVVPFLEGQTKSLLFRSVRVGDWTDLQNFNSVNSQLVYMPHKPTDGQEFRVNFGPYYGDHIIVGLGQDGPSGWGSSRMFGVRDIYAHANVPLTINTVVPGRTIVTQQQRQVGISSSGSLTVTAFRDEVRQATHSYSGAGSLSGVTWTNVTVSDPEINVSMTSSGQITFRSQLVSLDISAENFSSGPAVPGGTYYSMDENRVLNPVREVGLISKSEGLKLLCNLDRSPYGFPATPTAVGPNEYQRHFITLTLVGRGSDTSVRIGFYDISRREFIVNAAGQPELSYIEWVNRGPQNVYIGVITTYEQSVLQGIPEDNDAPKLPYRWAMPVYGVYKRGGSRITLEPLPANLGLTDIWPIAVREGSFSRQVMIRARAEGYLTTWLREYQDTSLRAFYGLPESGGWSTLYGPPNADIVGEEPEIVDDNVIRVRQAPIYMVHEPAQISGWADPVRPIFVVYRRESVLDPWVAQSWDEIEDYNVSTGEIILRTQLSSDDPALIKVDYTTERRHFYFKRYQDTLLNLNPYAGQLGALLGQALYVYIVPLYVRDAEGNPIAASVTDEPLRFTTDPAIFDPIRPEYDPLAIQLGVIFVSAALELSDLTVLDTRRRGGGIRDSANVREIARLVNESSAYWDVGYGAGSSYPKGGYVVVRLPEELKDRFTEAEVAAAVGRNLTAGVGFRLEDLTGGSWS